MPIPLSFSVDPAPDPASESFIEEQFSLGPLDFLEPAFREGASHTAFGVGGSFYDVNKLRSHGQDINDAGISGYLYKGTFNRLEELGIVDPVNQDSSIRRLSPDEANEKFGIEDELKFDRPISEEAANIIYLRKKDEITRREALSRVNGLFDNTLAFTAELFGELSDPLGLATVFFPNIAVARGANFIRRSAAAGAIEGGVGTAGALGLGGLGGEELKSDFDAQSAAIAITFGAAFGAGLRAGAGKIADSIASRAANKLLIDESESVTKIADAIENAPEPEHLNISPEADEAAVKTAAAEILDDKPVTTPEKIVDLDKPVASTPTIKVTRYDEGVSSKDIKSDEDLINSRTDNPGDLIKRIELIKKALKPGSTTYAKALTNQLNKQDLRHGGPLWTKKDKVRIAKTYRRDLERELELAEEQLDSLRRETSNLDNAPSFEELVTVLARHVGKIEKDGRIAPGNKEELEDILVRANIPLGTTDHFVLNIDKFKKLIEQKDRILNNPRYRDSRALGKEIARILGIPEGDSLLVRGKTLKALNHLKNQLEVADKEKLVNDLDLEDSVRRQNSEDFMDKGIQDNDIEIDSLNSDVSSLDSEIVRASQRAGRTPEETAEIQRLINERDEDFEIEEEVSKDTLECLEQTFNGRRNA